MEIELKKRNPHHQMIISKYRILALFLAILISWGLAWPINKIGLEYMSPLWYTAARLVIGTISMFIILLCVKKFSLPQRSDIPLILNVGILQVGAYILLTNVGLAWLPAGRSSLIAYTTPLWVMPIATLVFKEKASLYKWMGFVLGLAGLIILISPWQLNWADYHVLLGSAALLLGSLCWALSMFGIRYLRWTKSPLELIPWQLLAGTIPILIFVWFNAPHLPRFSNFYLLLSLLYTGVLVTGVSYWLGVILNKELSPIALSLGFLAVPVVSLVISTIFMNESINLVTAGAAALILLGLAFISMEK